MEPLDPRTPEALVSEARAVCDDDAVEVGSPLKHASVKKMLSITGTGVIGLILAAWAWAEGTTKIVTKHDTLLVGSGPLDPGMEQRLRTLELYAATADALRREDHARLARVEEAVGKVSDAVQRVAEKVGARPR